MSLPDVLAFLADPRLPVWAIAALATAGVIVRPWGWPEAIWAVAGAMLLVVLGLLPSGDALAAIGRGTDVYLFLIGMMLLAEVARQEGLFDWLAAHAVGWAHRDGRRLFAIVYAVGTIVTIFLSNDATAVVLTPAVAAAARAAKAEPLPYLFVCAFIANAASFVLPISNPANLVIYGKAMPPLGTWLATFALPSALAIVATYVALRLALRRELAGGIGEARSPRPLPRGGRIAGVGIVVTALALGAASALDLDLGAPTFACGVLVAVAAIVAERRGVMKLLRGVSWSVLPLVAGLFVLVAGLERTGLTALIAGALRDLTADSPAKAAGVAGLATAFGSNLVNNLPMGLFAASAASAASAPALVKAGLVVGVDVGPNLSVTGSLATILWLVAIRRDGTHVGGWRFLRLGLVVMPPALVLALAGLLANGWR